MIRRQAIQKLFEARCQEHRNEPAAGRRQFVAELREQLGITVNDHGQPCIRDQGNSPREFSLRTLGEGILGRDVFEALYDPERSGSMDALDLYEAGPGIDPTAFLNVSAFSSAVAGLIEAQMLEAYNSPSFVMDQVFPTVPTRLNGQKLIGTGGIGRKAKRRSPGEPHARAGFGEQWVRTPETVEDALCVEVTQEAAFFDLTGEVLDRAANVGEAIRLEKEYDCIDVLVGIVNPYEYMDTGYATYQDTEPWVNDQNNPLVDYNDLDESRLLFNAMSDPTTGQPITVVPNMIVSVPSMENTIWHVLNSTQIRKGSQEGDVTTINNGQPPAVQNKPTIITSEYLYRVSTAAEADGGLGLNAANAKRWYHLQAGPRGAFAWMENWPLRVRAASANEYVMLDRGIIAAYFASQRGVPVVRDPRKVVRNKVA